MTTLHITIMPMNQATNRYVRLITFDGYDHAPELRSLVSRLLNGSLTRSTQLSLVHRFLMKLSILNRQMSWDSKSGRDADQNQSLSRRRNDSMVFGGTEQKVWSNGRTKWTQYNRHRANQAQFQLVCSFPSWLTDSGRVEQKIKSCFW